MKTNHQHEYTRSKPSASVETCACGKFRHTENAGPVIVAKETADYDAYRQEGENEVTLDCGCFMTEVSFRFCPLHKNAPAMLMALKTAEKIISIARNYFPKSIRNRDRFTLELSAAGVSEILVKAEGKTSL